MTLGGLIRERGGDLVSGRALDRFISVGFRQRSVISSVGPRDEARDAVVVERTYKADIERDTTGNERAVIVATGLSNVPYLRLTLITKGKRHWYSLDGSRHGRLLGPPHLFDVAVFSSTLDEIPVDRVDDDGPTSLYPHVHAEDFTRLLRFTGSDPSPSEELDVNTYTVSLDFAQGTVISYDWSLRGKEESEWESEGAPSMAYRVSCSVTLSFRALHEALAIPPVRSDASLPSLPDVDSVWRVARERGSQATS